jgi:hypothetical protein
MEQWVGRNTPVLHHSITQFTIDVCDGKDNDHEPLVAGTRGDAGVKLNSMNRWRYVDEDRRPADFHRSRRRRWP